MSEKLLLQGGRVLDPSQDLDATRDVLLVDGQGLAHPRRFGLIKPFDPRSEAVAEEIAAWAATPGAVGARVMLTSGSPEADDPGLNRIFAAGATAGIPVNVLSWGKLPLLRELAHRNPDTQVVVDHVGLSQPFKPPTPPEPFGDLTAVVSLAEYDNVAIKISGACTLSHQPFPDAVYFYRNEYGLGMNRLMPHGFQFRIQVFSTFSHHVYAISHMILILICI